MKKAPKPTARQIDAVLKALEPPARTVSCEADDISLPIVISPTVTFADRCRMVHDIAGLVFVDGVYAPYLWDFACAYVFLNAFTNVRTDTSGERQWALAQRTDILRRIDEAVGPDAVAIREDARELVQFYRDRLLHQSRLDELAEALTSLLQKLDGMAGSLKGADLTELLHAAERLGDRPGTPSASGIVDLQAVRNAARPAKD